MAQDTAVMSSNSSSAATEPDADPTSRDRCRGELAQQKTSVTGLIVGMVDTAMSARWDIPKVSPEGVVEQGYDGVVSGAFEVYADDDSRDVKGRLSGSSEELNAYLAERLEDF